jgi:metallo-beta-lactamase class B
MNACYLTAIGVVVAVGGAAAGQLGGDRIDSHVAIARAAAGQDHLGLFNALCSPTSIRPAPPAQRGQRGDAATAARPAPPDRSLWHAEPVRVFDNLYFVGQTEYSARVVSTSDGFIVIDTIFDYSVEDEVVGGMKKLGLDPAKIKYVLVSHGHGDHSGGARYLQDHFGARVLLSAADWELLARNTLEASRPRRDMVVTDGQKLTLGDTTLTLTLTPGHTEGTVSTLIPVKDQGRPHLVAEWGGTLFGGQRTREYFDTYIRSAERFRDIATAAGADVIISNHTNYDGSKTKLPALALRKPGDPNPYVIGKDAVTRYLTVAGECAKAAQAALN